MPRIGLRYLVAAIGLIFVTAVIVPPRSSNDLWSYSMYGRTVSVYSQNPYESVPADFRSDVFYPRVSPIWRHRASVFGPAFVGFAAAGTLFAGDSVLLDRLYFQLAAAAAAVGVLILVWRRTRSPAALAWLGLQPAWGAMAINGGHIDVLIGLGILIAALLAHRERGFASGLVIGIVALMKLTALLALVGVVLWAWRRRDTKLVIRTVVAAGSVLALAYIPIVVSASSVIVRADHTVTPASIWNPAADLLLGHDAGRAVLHPGAPNAPLTVLFWLSIVAVGILALVVGWRAARSHRPEPAVGGATASYTMAAQYTYPWYSAWALPTMTDGRPSRLAWIVWGQASLMLAAFALPLHPTGNFFADMARNALIYVAPLVLTSAFVVTGLRKRVASDAA